MPQSYINYDDMINFLNLIKVCDYGGLLAFQTDKEFEASQIHNWCYWKSSEWIKNFKIKKENIENRLKTFFDILFLFYFYKKIYYNIYRKKMKRILDYDCDREDFLFKE